ncbi:MAG TPA: acetate--CoA ligase family protein [Methanomassiliicoccales archaeon]
MRTERMRELFEPASIAVVGAAREENKVGHIVLRNIISSGFTGKLYPVNPKSEEILGLRCYASISLVPDQVDLVVVTTPAHTVPGIIEETGRKGTKAVIVISAGFKETGKDGAELERRIGEIARSYGMRILGPNCLGMINTHSMINATFTNQYPRTGSIAISSQSGAICSVMLDWAQRTNVGFSKFVSVGNKLDIDEADLLQYLRDDPLTKVIGMYIEGTDRGIEFMRQAKLTTRDKPIIALKAGRTSSGAKAASSHTGALSGSDRVYDAALAQSGIIRVKTIEELFDHLTLFSSMPLPEGDRIAIITNAGGLGVMAADACSDYGMTLASFKPETIELLKTKLPESANFYNPVDVIGDADADRYSFAVDAIMKDDSVSCILALMAPTDIVDTASVATALARFAGNSTKPFVTAFVGGAGLEKAVSILRTSGVPNYESPDRAVQSLAAMVAYKRFKDSKEDGGPVSFEGDKVRTKAVLDSVRSENRLMLSESEGKEILSAYGIDVPLEGMAKDADQAVMEAQRIGYPLVMKIESPDIAHKTDVGGVVVDIKNDDEVRAQFQLIMARVSSRMPQARIDGVSLERMVKGREVIVGMVRDNQFGPVVTFGLGGIFVEIMRDVSQRIAPLTRQDVISMIQSIKAYPILTGARGRRPADIAALQEVIGRLSQLAMDFPELAEFEMNPVIVGDEGQGASAVDALATIRRETA